METSIDPSDASQRSTTMSDRYRDNGNGTITDVTTGLIWEKKTFHGYGPSDDVHDMFNRYSWSINPASEQTGTAFTVFLKTLNDQRFANHSDWRLPTKQQLLHIVDHSQVNPRIDPIFGPTQGDFYWSADRLNDPPG